MLHVQVEGGNINIQLEEEDMVVENVNDKDEQPKEGVVEDDLQPLEEYHSGQGDVSMLTLYHLHVAHHMFDGIVRLCNFNFFVSFFI